MPISADQALSAAMRGVMQVNDVEGVDATPGRFMEFLEELDDALAATMDAAITASEPLPRDEETQRMVHHLAYSRLQTLLTVALFAAYHFPHYEHISRARIGQTEAIDG